jgi:hypothetical protein
MPAHDRRRHFAGVDFAMHRTGEGAVYVAGRLVPMLHQEVTRESGGLIFYTRTDLKDASDGSMKPRKGAPDRGRLGADRPSDKANWQWKLVIVILMFLLWLAAPIPGSIIGLAIRSIARGGCGRKLGHSHKQPPSTKVHISN